MNIHVQPCQLHIITLTAAYYTALHYYAPDLMEECRELALPNTILMLLPPWIPGHNCEHEEFRAYIDMLDNLDDPDYHVVRLVTGEEDDGTPD